MATLPITVVKGDLEHLLHHNTLHKKANIASDAELETLTDGSNADSLHVHAGGGGGAGAAFSELMLIGA